ncbi:MAG: hypothetical protein JXA54_14810 [Candidatus Heimdallarchaeota archaeon]|nr:hypothetical protein [Candidatus Heimdallarchaeota archaeon]
MRKGPLIAAGILFGVSIIMIIIGGVMFTPGLWPDWLLWFGIVIFNIGLIILVISFIKKPGAEEEPAKKIAETSA